MTEYIPSPSPEAEALRNRREALSHALGTGVAPQRSDQVLLVARAYVAFLDGTEPTPASS